MYVRVSYRAVTVEEPDDCTSLAVRVTGVPLDRLGDLLDAAGLGRSVGDGHAELVVSRLRALASTGVTGADWPARWDGMLAYAGRHGWLSADGATVRAHVEPDTSAGGSTGAVR